MTPNILLLTLLVSLTGAIISPANFDSLMKTVKAPLVGSISTMGATILKNNLTVYAITNIPHKNIKELQGKPAILVSSYMHAREPYSVQLAQSLLKKMINGEMPTKVSCFLNQGVFIMFPFVNMDSYYKYIAGGKDIRKNQNGDPSQCKTGMAGVDINRNFPSDFGLVRQSGYQCGQQYHGISPFSEQQSQAFMKLFGILDVLVAVDIHSYGNQWIYPYASDQSGKKLKSRRNYGTYLQVIDRLKSHKSEIKSCWESLNYIADGVYIDWAADQGALSLAYQIGKNFNFDNQIDQQIEKALSDFDIVFQTGLLEIETCQDIQQPEQPVVPTQNITQKQQMTYLVVTGILLFYTLTFLLSYCLSQQHN